MTAKKNPDADLKLKYRKTIELAFVIALLMQFALIYGFPTINMTPGESKHVAIEIKVEEIPVTEHVKIPPAPPRPSIPIPTESENVPEDLTIESTELDWDMTKLPPPPPAQEEGQDMEDRYVFVPYDEAPMPIGGMAAIQGHLKYPELAKKVGLEGLVVVGVLIDEKGNPMKTEILKSAGVNIGFDEAAQDAVMAVKWKPAKQRDKPVKVWVSIPVRFKLTEAEQRRAS